jgi:hypothetical protein
MTTFTRVGLTFLSFGAMAAFLLTTEHRAPSFGVLPLLFLLACPLLHRFMHGHHSQHQAPVAPNQGAGHAHPGTREEEEV